MKKQKQDRTAERGRFAVGELMMKNELLAEKARLLEGNAPGFPWRKSRA
ncbi:hypothetical protein [Pyxidicoccus sp. MSG2]|nr:hypothetical protein [Pyxidicoccus sp. MSG2]MCY1019304.1 hypothetical protein [Pyxidicoccus sp. MSG2]